MRLIDADRIIKEYTSEDMAIGGIDIIKTAPTVEAIPIEWLKRFKAGECQDSYWSWFTDRLIKMWREEKSKDEAD